MIEFRHVGASYDSTENILEDIDFVIEDEDFVAFVGTNGAGKSTTMRLMNGLLKPNEGEVLIDGISTASLKTSQLARKVGFLFQNPDRQICRNTVREELLFGFEAIGDVSPEAHKRVDDIIERFGFDADADPFLLNRGTRQLLALASIIVLEPAIIILDEPTTGLDHRECELVMSIVEGLHEKGTTVVMVCHDMEVVADHAKRVIVMAHGKIQGDGATFDVLRDETLCARASLIPPQIIEIALRLEHDDLSPDAQIITSANTVEQMTDAIANHLMKAGA